MSRSFLYVPGNREDVIPKAVRSAADAIILDLEDAVPEGAKDEARSIVSRFLKGHPEGGKPCYVRLNVEDAGACDLVALDTSRIAGVRIAKAESAAAIGQVDRLLADLERREGRRIGSVRIHPLIESVKGLYLLDELARASNRVERVAFGAGDFVHDIGGQRTDSRAETFYARTHLVARSRFLGLMAPIAHSYGRLSDLDGLKKACVEDRSLGFFGRSCIHPKLVDTINEAFTHSTSVVEKAKAIVLAYEKNAKQGTGAFLMDDGTFVDEAGLKRARRIILEAAHADQN